MGVIGGALVLDPQCWDAQVRPSILRAEDCAVPGTETGALRIVKAINPVDQIS